ncbi:hypothetical protein ABPG75_007812 [Micractinium tetrahymenae]
MARCTAVLLLAAILAQTAAGRVLQQASSTSTISGRAIVIAKDVKGQAPQRLLGVQTPDGRRIQVQLANAAQAAGLHSGMHLELTGHFSQPPQQQQQQGGVSAMAAVPAAASSRTFAAASIRAFGAKFAAPKVTVAGGAAPAGVVSGAAVTTTKAATVLSTNQLVTSDVSTIFIPIAGVNTDGTACTNTALPSTTAAQVRKAVFQELNPGGVTVGSTYNKCSYGKTKLTQANSLVADTVQLPCNGTTNGVAWSFETCNFNDFNGWSDAADEALRAQGVNLDAYKYKVYLLPPSACAFVGLGYVGCDGSYECRAWIGADFWTTPQAIAHELGHNLFLAHAGAPTSTGTFDDYADLSGVMGYCCSDRCPNTPHAWQLGWISVQQLDGTSLKPGQTVQTILTSNSASPRSGMRIVPSWAAGVDPIFLGYRTKVGGDASAGPNIVGKLHINSAAITNTFDPQITTWSAALAANQAWTHPTAGLVVRVKAAFPGSATVTICRKAGAETLASCRAGTDNDCNGLAGSADPVCARLLRRAAATAAPVRRT